MVCDDIMLERSYTPVLSSFLPQENEVDQHDERSLHFVIKTYGAGAVTQHISKLGIGSNILLSDNLGFFDHNILFNVRNLVIVYAGTGLTPMIKVINEFLRSTKNKKSKCTLTILSFNKTEKDIIWKDKLEALEKSFREALYVSIDVYYILSQEKNERDKRYRYGRISSDLLNSILLNNETTSTDASNLDDISRYCCICGPIPFNQEAKRLFEKEFHYSHDQIYVFEG